jgi:hypothetical protein
MHPRSLLFAVVTAIGLGAAAAPATAQPDAAPTEADIAAAKKAFGEGKALFDQKKYGEAVDKFKESYRLSKRPTLLYNIAISLELNKQKDMALFYYRKFMSDAPADDAQRPDAQTRMKALEGELGTDAGKTDAGTPDGGTPDGGKTDAGTPDGGKTDGGKPDKPVKQPITVKPAGTYTAADFKHRIVEEAPPAKPLDLTAAVPDDSGFTVTLFFRGAGEAQFTSVPMKWRYNELVGRIPAAKMSGTSVQYYIDVKDPAGTIVTKVAKATSPNVIYLEAAASPQFYPDWNPDAAPASNTPDVPTGDGNKVVSTGGGRRPIDDEDPLRNDTSDDPLRADTRVATGGTFGDTGTGGTGNETPGGSGNGFFDVGSSKFTAMKWGTTAVGAGLLATSIVFYIRAGDSASTLEQEATNNTCFGGEEPPCEFDPYLQDAESTGKSAETISMVTFGVGVAITAVAGYYWIKQLRGAPAPKETKANRKKRTRTFIATPAIGDGVLGGAAAWEW